MNEFLKYIIIFFILTIFNNCSAQDESAVVTDTSANDYFYYFNSNPYNAFVNYKDSVIGITPLRFYTNKKLEGNLIFRKDGFRDLILNLNNYDFKKGFQSDLEKISNYKLVEKDRESQFKKHRDFFIIGSTGFLAILSGYTSIVFKNIANDSYDSYQNSLNPSDLSKSNRYDIYSGIALAVMQASFIGLIYLLFFK